MAVSKKKQSSAPDRVAQIKIAAAVTCLVAAGALIAFNFGLFEGKPKPIIVIEPEQPPEKIEQHKKRVDQAKQAEQELIKKSPPIKGS